jgi:hypothetical protein
MMVVPSGWSRMHEEATGGQPHQSQIHNSRDAGYCPEYLSRRIPHHESFPFTVPLCLSNWAVYR